MTYYNIDRDQRGMCMWDQNTVHELVEKQRRFFRTDRTLDVKWRKEQLIRLKIAVQTHEKEIAEALYEDLGRSRTEAYLTDTGVVIAEINEILKGLSRWAKPETHYSGLLCFPSTVTKVFKMPYGVTLIISPFNFPILLSLGVLAASISAGNTAVIKASSKSSRSTAVLQKIISSSFPAEYITVVDGGHDVADLCLNERFDKIFYTGSPAVGKHVLHKAAEHLTPSALELGGENGNWCIIRKDADLKDAARKIAFFKLLNAGQICININQIAVAEEVYEEFTEYLKQEFDRQIGNALENPEYPHLINEAAFDRCEKEAKQYEDRIIYGGKGDRDTLKFEPTVIGPVKTDEKIVIHELFCPLLPVVTYPDDAINDLLDVIAEREHGLALYLFTKDMKWAVNTMKKQQYGGGCINEVCVHLMVKGVPFNGTGHSGMGAYHGEWGFREFTHPSTVLIGKTKGNLSLREHPYNSILKLNILKISER